MANTGLNEVNLRKSCDEWPGTDKGLSLGKQNVSGEAAKIESRLSLAPESMNVVVPGVQDAARAQIQGMNIAKWGLSVEVLCVQNATKPQTLRLSVAEPGMQGDARVSEKMNMSLAEF